MRDASDDGGSAARAQPPRPSRTMPAGADFALCKGKRLCYSRTLARVVPGSSAVEQPAVNRLVDGSNPSRGANANFELCFLMIFSAFCQTSRRFDTGCSRFHL